MNKIQEILKEASIDQLDNLLDTTNEWFKESKDIEKYSETTKAIMQKKYSILQEITIGKSNKSIFLSIAPSVNQNYGDIAYFKVFRKGNLAKEKVPCWRILIFKPLYESSHSPMERKPLSSMQKEELCELLVETFDDSRYYNLVLTEINKEAMSKGIILDNNYQVINWQAIIYFFNILTNDKEYISYFTPIPDYKLLPNKYN